MIASYRNEVMLKCDLLRPSSHAYASIGDVAFRNVRAFSSSRCEMGRRWLVATIGKERLEKGDEFGCYGMPNLEWKADPGAVAL